MVWSPRSSGIANGVVIERPTATSAIVEWRGCHNWSDRDEAYRETRTLMTQAANGRWTGPLPRGYSFHKCPELGIDC